MQRLADICIRRPVFASMLILALVVVGAASYFQLGVDRMPSVDFPTVRVSTTLPGASPTEVETEVSQIIEEAVNTVDGINELRSISGAGMSLVIATFDLDRDISDAAQDVRDRVSTVVRDLPRETDPPVISKFDTDLSPVMTIALVGERSIRELTEIADKIVKPQLERSPGVGEVQIVGGLERAMSIRVDADRLNAYGLPVTAVRDAIVRQNANIPGGNVSGELIEHALRTMGRVTDAEGFENLVVATVNGSPIRIRDLGGAEDGTKEQRSFSRLDGAPTVTLEIRRQSGANTVSVIEGLKARLGDLEGQLPGGLKLEVIEDQSRYIYNALHEITLHLVLGSVLASLVVLFFMRNWRATLIAAVAIPCSVIATFAMMRALDFTLNSVTMLALVLMVGIVIDDAIVVLENIFRWIEEKKMSPFEAARAGTAEIALPVMATTFSLVVIFVPVSFMSSISGRFLFQFGLTSAVAVLVSLLVSFTLTPMMSARLFRRTGHSQDEPRSRQGFYGMVERNYLRALRWALRHRGVTGAVALAVVLSAIPLYRMVPQEYVPTDVDEGEFEVRVTAPEGTALGPINTLSKIVEDELASMPEVRQVLATAGGGFLGSVNQARFYVRVAPHDERLLTVQRLWAELKNGRPWAAFDTTSQREIMQRLRQRLSKYSDDVRTSVSNVRNFSMGGSRWDIDFALLGPDLEKLALYAEKLRGRSKEIGIVDADTTLKLDKPELHVQIDRERAAALGVETSDIASALRVMVGGDDRVSRFYDPTVNDSYDVQIRLYENQRRAPGEIAHLFVPARDGRLVRLDNVVDIVPAEAASRIDRLDRQRQVSLRAGVAPGYALADRLVALDEATEELNLPAGYTTRIRGTGSELETTFREFLFAFALSIVFMYMILASQFESVVHPFTILLSLPLCIPFALLSLWMTGTTLNLYSALGLLVLFGVVKKNAILQIDHMIKLSATGMERGAAILQANRDRLRPILMTTLTLVAGMLPLALGNGPGAEERRSIAVIVIGGQSLALFLTLVVTPVAYSFFEELRGRRKRISPVQVPAAPEPVAVAVGVHRTTSGG